LKYFVLNTKNYSESSGENLDNLLEISNTLSKQKAFQDSVQLSLAMPAFCIEYAARKFPKLPLLAQHLDNAALGATTGFLVPEMAKSFGATGSLVNHSEHRITGDQIEKLVMKMNTLSLVSIVCARDDQEVKIFSKLSPTFIAIEPPELIGSGVAVSKVRPELIKNSKRALDDSKPKKSLTKLLCGAGIVDEIDAKMAVELGAEGVLVASGVIKAPDWKRKISELAQGIISAK
jgi:triosephosphate isomerase